MNSFIVDIADLREKAKRKHSGGVPKGRSWTKIAEGIYLTARWLKGDSRRTWLSDALSIIYAHSRKPSTRAEARRLLKILEGRK